jgi:hypothetical protein
MLSAEALRAAPPADAPAAGDASPASLPRSVAAPPAAPQLVGSSSIMGGRGSSLRALAVSTQGFAVTGSQDGVLQV